MTALQAIRAKCLDCSNSQLSEVRNCNVKQCPLCDFRMGHKPKDENASKRTLSAEHLAKLQEARNKRSILKSDT